MARSIVFAPGAEANPLSSFAYETLRERTRPDRDGEAWRRRELEAVRATVGLVAKDRRLTATIRFDRGSVVVHDGSVGTPDVTFFGSFDALVSLATRPLSRIGRLPVTPAWGDFALATAAGDIKVFGLLSHPRLVLRLLRLFGSG